MAASTEDKGFGVAHDTVDGATLVSSFVAVKRYKGHVVDSLRCRTHSLAPLSFRGASYWGRVYAASTNNRPRPGASWQDTCALVEAGKRRPLLNQRHFSVDVIGAAQALVEGALGEVAAAEVRAD